MDLNFAHIPADAATKKARLLDRVCNREKNTRQHFVVENVDAGTLHGDLEFMSRNAVSDCSVPPISLPLSPSLTSRV